MTKNKTHEEFMKDFYKKNSNAHNIEVLEKYQGVKIKIKCKCKICNCIWTPTPSNLLQNTKCPICSKKNMINKKTKTHKQFMKDFYEKNSNAENIEILGKYVNANTKILCRCKIDNYIWEVTPHDLLKGYGCPKCNGNAKKTHEEFIKELEEINSNIEVLEKYKGALTKIKCKCKICSCIWTPRPSGLLNNQGCPKCAIDNQRKTHEEFIKELQEINSNIEVLEKYINSKAKIKCKCKIDNHIWKVRPHDLLNGQGCPICNTSKGEKRILKYLNENNIEHIYQMFYSDLRGINDGLLSYDFYLPTYNLLIEYQGEYHDHTVSNQSDFDFTIQQEHDRRKKEYATNNGIKLLEIWYQDYDNIEKILNKYLIN